MEKQKVIENATQCLDALKTGHRNYCSGSLVEFADKIYEEWEDFYATVVMMAKEPERKKGAWIEYIPEHGKCPFCGNHVDLLCKANNFCGECGADMRGEQDE